jgi:lysophospholipase L1-like esterase
MTTRQIIKVLLLEHLKKYCSHSWGRRRESGLFGFWRRFGSVTGFSNMLLRQSLAKNPKILAPNGHIIFLNALVLLGLSGFAERVCAQDAAGKPVIFVCGDSTARNSGTGKNGEPMVGWGTPITNFFDPGKVVIKNVGHAGRSSRTYYDGDWPKVLPQINAGDYVLLVFGINDGSTPPGLGDDVVMRDGLPVHTYGWYMTKMATDAQAKGAHVFLLTVTTRNIWSNPKVKFNDATPIGPSPGDYDPRQDRIERGTGSGRFTQWTKDIGQKLHLPVFDLTDFCADKYEGMGREEVNKLYSDHNHTYMAGAEIVAAAIVSGLKAFDHSPFVPLLSDKGKALETADAKYVSDNPAPAAFPPVQISDVPRNTQMGTPPAPDGAPGNGKYFPPLPANPALPTLWLIGDSTVRNGTLGDGSNQGQWGWGAPITAYFDLEKINVVNRAFGGTSSHSFYAGFFWQNLRPQIKKGDFVIMQFGANDNGSASGKGTGPETQTIVRNGITNTVHTFGWYLQQYVTETRAQGATPIICSLTPRKYWTSDGHFRRDNTTHAAWAAEIAGSNNVPFVDLYELIARKYESLGTNAVDKIYVPSPREKLHTGWDGAGINAECVIAGLKGLKENPLAPFLSTRGQAVAPIVLTPLERFKK